MWTSLHTVSGFISTPPSSYVSLFSQCKEDMENRVQIDTEKGDSWKASVNQRGQLSSLLGLVGGSWVRILWQVHMCKNPELSYGWWWTRTRSTSRVPVQQPPLFPKALNVLRAGLIWASSFAGAWSWCVRPLWPVVHATCWSTSGTTLPAILSQAHLLSSLQSFE